MMFGCMRRIVFVAVLALLAGVGWMMRDTVRDRVAGWFGRPEAEMTEDELAVRAEGKLDALASGDAREPVAFSELEAQALVRRRMGPALPGFVHDPTVDFETGTLRLSARVPVDQVPQVAELGEAAMFLPDTADVVTRASLIPLTPGHAALAVDEISIARVPIPKRLIPRLIGRLRGAIGDSGGPADAVPFTLPPGVGSAYIRGDSLILVPAREPVEDTGV